MDTQRSKSQSYTQQPTHHYTPLANVEAAPILALTQDWQSSVFGNAIALNQSSLADIAEDAGMAIGVTDPCGTLLWTWSSRAMRTSAEQVHFVEGGQWDLQSVGTNALGLALHTHTTSCVYSHENAMQSVRDWVCYATPIIDKMTKQYYGIVNLSTKYKKHSILGKLAVERCSDIILGTLQLIKQDRLIIHAFGTPQISFNHQPLTLTHRQIEILCILALCPAGISLDELHYALYGDREVSSKTLKSEISQLRHLLNDQIQSRSYRLTCEVQCDFITAEQSLNSGCFSTACNLYKGNFLSKSDSPFLRAWRESFDARLSYHIHQSHDVEQLLALVQRAPDRIDAVERLLDLLPVNSPYRDKIAALLML
ncbi:winged helix-turn-helix domain-containing protein [Acinetobacter populi]|jgi:transcriptional regulator of acetoin/glycerol metabolism|uniref:Transcriptional regulator n=1 Tax=Acinetobacter populi TaxID=1582270 RepID=A0A1Z9YZH1_9GAMM|nr:helix-turn-helix domain-containing protein [Acinetobacter populi]MCH4247381.1 transcriptional regulator [Acinetobacter populi]OUY07604.1 transcriptional regulator [Acinetobacter populi]